MPANCSAVRSHSCSSFCGSPKVPSLPAGGEGNGPRSADAKANRIIRIRVRPVIESDLAARSQNNNAALEGRQLQHAIKRNGFGAVQQVEARAAKALASSKCNRTANTFTRMLVDQHHIGLARTLVAKCAQPGLWPIGHNGLQPRVCQRVRHIGKWRCRKPVQIGCAIRVIKSTGHFVSSEHRDAHGHHAPHRLRCCRANKRGAGHDKRLVAAAVNSQHSIGNRNLVAVLILKSLGRHKVKIDLRARELGRYALDGHGVAGPFGAGMVQNGDGAGGSAS